MIINEVNFIGAKIKNIATLLSFIMPLIYLIAAGLLLGFFFYGAYHILKSDGDAEMMQKGKQQIKYSILGFCMVVMSYFFVKLLGFIAGINFML